ncbi:hypothetical protein [Paraburkholderia sp.]|uniref:hypothetical protein n=1 Tax=Paraburkholderia sp. TaxID=1926495 RepID=UPI003D6DAD7E
MTGITLQGGYPVTSFEPMTGTSSTGGLSQQDILQFIQELLAMLQNAMPGQAGDDSSSTPPVGGTGGAGGSGFSPTAFNAAPPATNPAPPATNTAPPVANPAPQPTPVNPASGVSGASGTSGTGATGLSNNAGGVPQAAAIDGVSPASTQTINTGTGSDKTFNFTNDTNRTQSFTYSVQGANKATMTLAPGQTGTFTAGSGDIGVRISPSDANGNTHPNEVLYEDGGADNGQTTGAGNPDISKVDGNKDFGGNAENMTVTLSDGRMAGDGDAIRAYMNPTDDAAAMGLAGDPSKTVNITMSDAT